MKLRTLALLALSMLSVRVQAQANPASTPEKPAPSAAPAAQASESKPEVPTATPDPAEMSALETGLSQPAAAEAEALSASEMEALGLGPESSGVDTDFHFSGFADFTIFVPIKPRGGASLGLGKHSTAYVGNFNFYVSKNLSESFRMMGEVRFTYLPNGSLARNDSGFGYQQTQALDYADNSREFRWGAIILQRVYLEWTLHRLATARIGQFLTPYGIWNVDHGSPAYIPAQRPYAISHYYFPERQTGLEVFGRWDASNRSTLGYHLTLSNGTGPISEYRDLDENKAVGGRLYWEHHGAGYFRLGASGYYGRETDAQPTVSLTGKKLVVGDKINIQYDSLALAADALLKIRNVHLQLEWVSQQRRYTPAGRAVHDVPLAGRGFSTDSLSWAGYLLLAYQFDWYALTPFIMSEYVDEVKLGTLADTKSKVVVVRGGINVHPIDSVTFKCEYAHSRFIDGGAFLNGTVNNVQFQAAWAF